MVVAFAHHSEPNASIYRKTGERAENGSCIRCVLADNFDTALTAPVAVPSVQYRGLNNGTVVMAFHATAWILAFSTLFGPSLCCCTTTAVESGISSWFGCGPVTCQTAQCCHPNSAHRGGHASEHARHHHVHGASKGVALAQQTSSENRRQPVPPECPCRQDRSEVFALPAVADAAASVGPVPLDWIWVTVAPASSGANTTAFARPTLSHGPDTACQSGREILRAHCVLRI